MQVPGATRAWLKFAGFQAVVRWQASHDIVVGRCFARLPEALDPLWQVKHSPRATP
jgi:hypothetical protein